MRYLLDLIRLFFLHVQHYGHQMDATFAYDRGDFADYADSLRRANQIESEILAIRMSRKSSRKVSSGRVVVLVCIVSASAAFWIPAPAESKPTKEQIRTDRHRCEACFEPCAIQCRGVCK